MRRRPLTAASSPPVQGQYPQAVEISGVERWLFLSGQIPVAHDGTLAASFEGQCRQVWANLEDQLVAADMTLDHLVKVTTYLADRRDGADNRRVRLEVLGDRQPALTVIVTGLFEADWRVEIEAIAAA